MNFQLMSGDEVIIHPGLVNSVLFAIIISIFAIIINKKLKKANPTDKPKGILNLMEIVVSGINNLTVSTMGEKNAKFAPYIGTLAFFLVVSNLSGLLGFIPPTSDYNVTLGLALITFFMVQFFGLKSKGLKGYLKGYFEPFPFMFPINVVGEIANPISMSFRLFGNILSGVIIMALLYHAMGYFIVLLAPALHMYFDIFAGLVQTFIFMMLTMVFVSMGMGD